MYKEFYLDDYLKVSYGIGRSYSKSIIKLRQNHIVIDTLGNVLTPDKIERAGKWHEDRVADTLPMEYVLPN